MNRSHIYILASLLTAIGLGLFAYKAFYLNFPLAPNLQTSAWLIEAHASFTGRNKPVKLELFIPKTTRRFSIVDESFISRGFGLSTQDIDENRQAVWSIRKAVGKNELYYRAVVRKNTVEGPPIKYKPPEKVESRYEGADLAAAKSLIEEVRSESADTESLISRLIAALDKQPADSHVKLLLGKKFSSFKKVDTAARVLAATGIPARVVHGVSLDRPSRHAEISYMLEVFEDNTWKGFDWKSRGPLESDNFLAWWRGAETLTRMKGGDNVEVKVSLDQYQEEALVSALQEGSIATPALLSLSLFNLPLEAQGVYRVLLLMPLGGLIMAALRSLIGIRTFGTFMPVLIALAFRETELGWGVILFSVLVALGLVVRFYFEQLKLMLVPRLAAILTVVVMLMAAVSLITHRLGLNLGLSVALFPMVIITMTIERMSTVWDELGPRNAILQGANSLLCAAVIYLVITVKSVEHLVFVFPELLLVVLALSLLLGRYTGYRLFEYFRFRALLKDTAA